jgi:hypothetical protein
MKIIEDEEQSLDELVVRARNDSKLKELMQEKVTPDKQYQDEILVYSTLEKI